MAYNFPICDFHMAAPTPGNIGIAVFTGAGASAPTVAASTVCSLKVNLANRGTPTITRNGVGDYTFTLPATAVPTIVYAVIPVMDGTSGQECNHKAALSISSGALTVRVQVSTTAGVAADATTADNIRLILLGSTNSAG